MYLPKWNIKEKHRVKACHVRPPDSVITSPLLLIYQGHPFPPLDDNEQ